MNSKNNEDNGSEIIKHSKDNEYEKDINYFSKDYEDSTFIFAKNLNDTKYKDLIEKINSNITSGRFYKHNNIATKKKLVLNLKHYGLIDKKYLKSTFSNFIKKFYKKNMVKNYFDKSKISTINDFIHFVYQLRYKLLKQKVLKNISYDEFKSFYTSKLSNKIFDLNKKKGFLKKIRFHYFKKSYFICKIENFLKFKKNPKVVLIFLGKQFFQFKVGVILEYLESIFNLKKKGVIKKLLLSSWETGLKFAYDEIIKYLGIENEANLNKILIFLMVLTENQEDYKDEISKIIYETEIGIDAKINEALNIFNKFKLYITKNLRLINNNDNAINLEYNYLLGLFKTNINEYEKVTWNKRENFKKLEYGLDVNMKDIIKEKSIDSPENSIEKVKNVVFKKNIN